MAEADLKENPGVVFLEGFIAALAVAAFTPSDISFKAAIAIACGVVLAWQWPWMHTIAVSGFGVIGAIATISAVGTYLGDDGCVTWLPLWGRILLLIGLGVTFAWGLLHSIALKWNFRDVGGICLGWFGMLELLTFASTAAAAAGALGVTVVIVGVLVLGFLLGMRPALTTLVIGVCMGALVVMGSSLVGTSAAAGTECLLVRDAWVSAFLYFLAFVPAMFLWVIFIRPFRGKRG